VGSLVETMLNLHLYNKIFYLIIVYGFFKVIYMCCEWLHSLRFFFGACMVNVVFFILSHVYLHCSCRKYTNFLVPFQILLLITF